MEKELYTIGIAGTMGTSVERMLTHDEYLLIKDLCDELDTGYESITVHKGSVDLGY